jgi:hypothetical protein
MVLFTLFILRVKIVFLFSDAATGPLIDFVDTHREPFILSAKDRPFLPWTSFGIDDDVDGVRFSDHLGFLCPCHLGSGFKDFVRHIRLAYVFGRRARFAE